MGDYFGAEVVSIGQACEMAGVSRRTIYNWIERDRLEWVRTAGGSIRIVAKSLWRRCPEQRHDARNVRAS